MFAWRKAPLHLNNYVGKYRYWYCNSWVPLLRKNVALSRIWTYLFRGSKGIEPEASTSIPFLPTDLVLHAVDDSLDGFSASLSLWVPWCWWPRFPVSYPGLDADCHCKDGWSTDRSAYLLHRSLLVRVRMTDLVPYQPILCWPCWQ